MTDLGTDDVAVLRLTHLHAHSLTLVLLQDTRGGVSTMSDLGTDDVAVLRLTHLRAHGLTLVLLQDERGSVKRLLAYYSRGSSNATNSLCDIGNGEKIDG